MFGFNLEDLLNFLSIYFAIFIIFLLINSFVEGTLERNITREDVKESFFWPFFLMRELGVLTRFLFNKNNKR